MLVSSSGAAEVVLVEAQLEIAVLEVAVAVLGLHAGLGRELDLDEGVGDVVVLVVVVAEAVGLVSAVARAERELLVDARDDRLARAVSFSPNRPLPARYLVAVEERIELVERERRRAPAR